MSRHRTGNSSVTVEILLHCLLRWLAGGSYLDIKLRSGINKPAFYKYIYKCIDEILDSKLLAYKFPETAKNCMKLHKVLKHLVLMVQ